MIYKNCSNVSKIYHGVTFKPGDIKEVKSYINDKTFILCKCIPNKKSESNKPVSTTDNSSKKDAGQISNKVEVK